MTSRHAAGGRFPRCVGRLPVAWVACVVLALACRHAHGGRLPILDWTERSDWINVKTDVTPGAVGDGVADDTAAIQAALSSCVNGTTVYFPPGVYSIANAPGTTNALALTGPLTGVTLIGHGRLSVLKWSGDAGGRVLRVNGSAYCRYVGLLCEGGGTAAVGFYHDNDKRFETKVAYRHMGFYNFTSNGVESVYEGSGVTIALSEPSFENCVFDHCAVGLNMVAHNDYNFTVTGCDFIHCGVGVYCKQGSYYIRDCYFEGSTSYDIGSIVPEHGVSVRRCVSKDSQQFMFSGTSAASTEVQDCYISGWANPGSQGGALRHQAAPLVLINNRFVDPPDPLPPVMAQHAATRVVVCNNAAPGCSSVVSIPAATAGQLYTVPAGALPGTVSTNGENIVSFVNPVVGGTGFRARLVWGGADGGTTVSVVDPMDVRLENITIGCEDIGVLNVIDVEQTSTGADSRMTYDGVFVYGLYRKDLENKGLRLNGLGSNCTVVLNYVTGDLRLLESDSATILANITYEGGVVVEGSGGARDGFFGIQTRLTTVASNVLVLRDNHSLVASDWYLEQGDSGFLLEGNVGDPTGRVVIAGGKYQNTSADSVFLAIDDYAGEVAVGPYQLYPATWPMIVITNTGSRAVDIVMCANRFYDTDLAFTNTGAASLNGLGNLAKEPHSLPTNCTARGLEMIAASFDDLQRMGNLDLSLNFAHLSGPQPTGKVALAVLSSRGAPTPAGGMCASTYGAVLTNAVGHPVAQGGIQYVCTGWVLEGGEPAFGATNVMVMVHTNDARLTWQWTTQLHFRAESAEHGHLVGMTNAWVDAGQVASVTAVADPYYGFDRWYGTTGTTVNPLAVPMVTPCAVTAAYSVLRTGNGIPLTWLDGLHKLGTNSAAEGIDHDGDGLTTLQEWGADTVPTNRDSRLALVGLAVTNGAVRVEWTGGVLATQYLDCADALVPSGGSWRVLCTNRPPTPTVTNYLHGGVSNRATYYRIRAIR